MVNHAKRRNSNIFMSNQYQLLIGGGGVASPRIRFEASGFKRSAHAKPSGGIYASVNGSTSPIARVEILANTTPNWLLELGLFERLTLKKGTKIRIHRPARETSGDHMIKAKASFENMTDMKSSPSIYLV